MTSFYEAAPSKERASVACCQSKGRDRSSFCFLQISLQRCSIVTVSHVPSVLARPGTLVGRTSAAQDSARIVPLRLSGRNKSMRVRRSRHVKSVPGVQNPNKPGRSRTIRASPGGKLRTGVEGCPRCQTGIIRTSLGAILFGAFAQPKHAGKYTIAYIPPVHNHPKISCSEVRAVPRQPIFG